MSTFESETQFLSRFWAQILFLQLQFYLQHLRLRGFMTKVLWHLFLLTYSRHNSFVFDLLVNFLSSAVVQWANNPFHSFNFIFSLTRSINGEKMHKKSAPIKWPSLNDFFKEVFFVTPVPSFLQNWEFFFAQRNP